jgi:hypothetical protein
VTRDPRGSTPDAGRDPADTPLLTVLRRYEGDGFTGQFDSRDGALVHCFACGEDHPAHGCRHGEIRRLEGASDPADMLAVVPVRCPGCGTRGVLVTNYGPEASAADAEVLRSLERTPRGGRTVHEH